MRSLRADLQTWRSSRTSRSRRLPRRTPTTRSSSSRSECLRPSSSLTPARSDVLYLFLAFLPCSTSCSSSVSRRRSGVSNDDMRILPPGISFADLCFLSLLRSRRALEDEDYLGAGSQLRASFALFWVCDLMAVLFVLYAALLASLAPAISRSLTSQATTSSRCTNKGSDQSVVRENERQRRSRDIRRR
jgi:hypothetical protein